MALDLTEDVLFVGRGSTAVAYYRCMLPAMALDCDWVGITGSPPGIRYRTGIARKGQGVKDSSLPPFGAYKVVVLQQPTDQGWFTIINELQEQGVKVVIECDDYLHGIPKVQSHDYRKHFDKGMLGRFEAMLKMADALIVSTEYIKRRYRRHNKAIWVCENGLDIERYNLTRPKREGITIGWAGATGHREALMPWLTQIGGLLRANARLNFVSIGQPWAQVLHSLGVEEHRALAVPFAAVEQYPAAMTLMDIALAPTGQGAFFRGKSDLRWLEAGALGIPIVASPVTYPGVEHRVTGMVAEDPQQAAVAVSELVHNPALREEIGGRIQRYVRENRTFPQAADQWARALEAIARNDRPT